MATFLTRSRLSKGDLRLYLTNQAGYSQDAVSVRWTIYSHDGRQVSGKELSAVKARVGEYYAAWAADVPNGNYRIVWKIQDEWSRPAYEKTEFFFVVDPSSYNNYGALSQSAVPQRGQWTYLSGTTLGRGDLPLFLTDENGPADASSVMWTVLDVAGRAVTSRTVANRAALGEYYASWTANVASGEYEIVWEWQQDSDSPLQSQRMRFSVMVPGAPYAVIIPADSIQVLQIDTVPKSAYIIPQIGSSSAYQVSCCVQPSSPAASPAPVVYPPPVGSGSSSSAFEIPRAVHLANGVLPPGGALTNQPAYTIPQAVRSITFYVSYVRGAAGGYASLRLLWGDGSAEYSETLLDTTIVVDDPVANQNLHLQEFDGPVPTDGNPVNFLIEASIPGGARTARLIAAEKGTPSTPGTLGITLTAST